MPTHQEILDGYLVLPAQAETVTFMTDASQAFVLLLAERSTSILSAEAAIIVERSLLGIEQPRRLGTDDKDPTTDEARHFPRLSELINTSEISYERARITLDWIANEVSDGNFAIASTSPKCTRFHVRKVEAGEAIGRLISNGKPVSADFPGQVLEAKINRADVFWYRAGVRMETKARIRNLGFEASVSPTAWPGMGLRPRPTGGEVGINCTGCAGCAVCGGCAGCVVCGPSPAGAIGLVGIDTTLGIVGVTGGSVSSPFTDFTATPGGGPV